MLLAAMNVATTGVQAGNTYLDAISNNIANSNTPGYKAGQVNFQDLLYTSLQGGNTGSPDRTLPNASQLGEGVAVGSIRGVFSQGSLNQSTGVFDLAINGKGFFNVVQRDGSTAYTRAGNFSADNTGRLVTSDGLPLAGNFIVPAGTTSLSVGADGTVTASSAGGVSQTLGQLTLTRFVNETGLNRVGDNLFVATAATGNGVTGAPGTSGLGSVSTGVLEQSNVELSTELTNLIVAQQQVSFNTRSLQTANSTVQSTLDLIA